jgi:RecA-family ATPase
VCIAAGIPWCGLPVERRRTLYLSCEDREGLLHWRLVRVCAALGVDLASLAGWLEIIDLVGHDPVLYEQTARGGATLAQAYDVLRQRVGDYGSEVVIIDGTSDTYAASENDRGSVKRFVNATLALVPADTGAVILLAHVNRGTAAGVASAEGYSGSTGWHNSVRSRWYLYPETRDLDGSTERTGDLILELQKANLGPADHRIRWRWDEEAHTFVGQNVTPAGAADRAARDRREREGILEALAACAESRIHVPAATSGNRTAYHVLVAQPSFPDSLRGGRPERKRFWRLVEELRRMGEIRDGSIRRPNRHVVDTLELGGAAP